MVANQRRDPILVVQGISDIQPSIEDATLLTKAHVMSLFGQAEAYADPSMPLAPHLMDAKLSLGPTTLIQDGIRRVGRIDRRSLHLGDTAPILPSTAPILVPRSRECLLAASGEHFVEATVMVLHSQRRRWPPAAGRLSVLCFAPHRVPLGLDVGRYRLVAACHEASVIGTRRRARQALPHRAFVILWHCAAELVGASRQMVCDVS
jgi:hypothetical protein